MPRTQQPKRKRRRALEQEQEPTEQVDMDYKTEPRSPEPGEVFKNNSSCGPVPQEEPQHLSNPERPGAHHHQLEDQERKPELDGSTSIPVQADDIVFSRVRLTRSALRELNWRNEHPSRAQPAAAIPCQGQKLEQPELDYIVGIEQDFSDIRGFPPPEHNMASQAVDSPATQQTRATKRISPYDVGFEMQLTDHRIYPPLHDLAHGRTLPVPGNLGLIREALRTRRSSLSSSDAQKSKLSNFQHLIRTRTESVLMRTVVPLMAGDSYYPNGGGVTFHNLNSLTGGTTVLPTPDLYDGVLLAHLEIKVRQDLNSIIVPHMQAFQPVAPNFFLEAKSISGSLAVAELQAVLDGAHGALIMHSIQNYLQAEPLYDGNAYAFSSILLGGFMTLYAHHVAAPRSAGQQPEYITTQLKSYALCDDETLLAGIGAFRNLRDLAKQYRDSFIEIANDRARATES